MGDIFSPMDSVSQIVYIYYFLLDTLLNIYLVVHTNYLL